MPFNAEDGAGSFADGFVELRPDARDAIAGVAAPDNEEAGLFLGADLVDAAWDHVADHAHAGFETEFAVKLQEAGFGVAHELVAVGFEVEFPGDGRGLDDVDEGKAGLGVAGDLGGFAGDNRIVFHAAGKGADDGAESRGFVKGLGVSGDEGPNSAGKIMQNFSGDGAQEQTAKDSGAVGGHHHEIDAGLCDFLLQGGSRFAVGENLAGFQAGEMFGGEEGKAFLFAGANFGGGRSHGDGAKEIAGGNGQGHQGESVEDGEFCLVSPDHVPDVRHGLRRGFRVVDGEEDFREGLHGLIIVHGRCQRKGLCLQRRGELVRCGLPQCA